MCYECAYSHCAVTQMTTNHVTHMETGGPEGLQPRDSFQLWPFGNPNSSKNFYKWRLAVRLNCSKYEWMDPCVWYACKCLNIYIFSTPIPHFYSNLECKMYTICTIYQYPETKRAKWNSAIIYFTFTPTVCQNVFRENGEDMQYWLIVIHKCSTESLTCHQ